MALGEGQTEQSRWGSRGEKNCQKAKKIIANTRKMALSEGQTEQSKWGSDWVALHEQG
jgi:hypothetical protein